MTKNNSVRDSALTILEKIEKNQSYSNLLLNTTIEKNNFSNKDARLLTEITYGTIQRKMTLDYYLEPFLHNKKKVENWVRLLLRLTLYQMVFLDRIPDHAAIYEAVEIAKKRGHKGIAGFVNGVLRTIQRKGVPSLNEIKDDTERLAIETSHPLWLVERWVNQFGLEEAKKICETNLIAPAQAARINETKTTVDQAISFLQEEGFHVEKSSIVPEGIKILQGNVAHSNAYKEGLLTIQDESSMLVAYSLALEGEEIVLDACAAPGGKSTHMGEKLKNKGKVISLDLHEHKVKLIQENARRLGLQNIETKVMDSRKARTVFEKESFDRILVDAPCSGLGVMRRKPDIKYSKSPKDIEKLATIQFELLSTVAPLLKKGGILVYSTCTIDQEENDLVVEKFLQEWKQFEGDETFAQRMPKIIQPLVKGFSLQIFPHYFGTDGFYIACLRKKV